MTEPSRHDDRLTKADLQLFRADFADLRSGIRGMMLKFFVPMWIGVYSMLGVAVSMIVNA